MVDAAQLFSLAPLDASSLDQCPRSHAVLELIGDDRCVQLAATADARSWLTERLTDQPADPPQDQPGGSQAKPAKVPGATEAGGLDRRGRPKADLRAITRSVRVYPCGSSIEADLRWLELAGKLCPDEIPAATPRLTYLTAADEHGVRRLVPVDASGVPPEPRAIGPFASAAAARRYAELGVDLLGLSRHPSLLDNGSPEQEAYLTGLDRWLDQRAPELASHVERLRGAMRLAAVEQRFEDAALNLATIEALEAFSKSQRHAIDRADRFRFLVITPAPRAVAEEGPKIFSPQSSSPSSSQSWSSARGIRPLVVTPDGWRALADRPVDAIGVETVMEADAVADDLGSNLAPGLVTGLTSGPVAAFAAPHLLRPPKAVSWFRLGSPVREDDLQGAARRAAGGEPRNDPAT
ncbi:MAG: hypothetical protein AAF108_05000 [Planctomycetota bacterium]